MFTDRKPTRPNRYKITPEDGVAFFGTLERADEATVEGTPLNAATLNKFLWDNVFTTGTISGRRLTSDGLLIQWGTVSITPSAVNTATRAIVTYQIPFTATPSVYVTPVSSVPENISVAIERSSEVISDAKKAVCVTLTRNGLTSTSIGWLAIGKGVI